jgi:hypothetical protein
MPDAGVDHGDRVRTGVCDISLRAIGRDHNIGWKKSYRYGGNDGVSRGTDHRNAASAGIGHVGVTPPFVKNCTLSREPEVTQRLSFCGAASGTALIRSRIIRRQSSRSGYKTHSPRNFSPKRTTLYKRRSDP